MKHLFTILVVMVALFLLANNVSAHPAWGIAVDRQGQVYFSDLETVWRVDAQGKIAVWRAGVRGRHTHDINLDENGNLYGVDNGYEPATVRWSAALWKITPSGKFSFVLAPTYNPPKAMTISKDRIGNSYYVGQSENAEREIFVLKRTPDGNVTTLAGSRKVGDEYRQVALYSLSQVSFGADGALYFRDGESIRKVTMDGKMTALPYKLKGRAGFTIDGQDNIFAADPENRRVLKISPGGESTAISSTEQPWMPNGVALSGSDLYILESWYDEREAFVGTRVRKLSADGKITVLATVGDKPKRAANDNPVVENTERSNGNQQNVPYILFVVGLGITTTIVVALHKRKRLFERWNKFHSRRAGRQRTAEITETDSTQINNHLFPYAGSTLKFKNCTYELNPPQTVRR